MSRFTEIVIQGDIGGTQVAFTGTAAHIAKIPLVLSSHIARIYKPA